MPGMSELLVILVIVLLIFGAGKLPQIGDALGRSIRNFKRAASSGEGEGDAAKREIEAGKRGELGAGRPEAQDAEIVAVKTETKKS